ncbi:hypothetical protein K505DRAFT_365114 [Melanomma pulvis-pyrius CBS 109.77]|uniref:DUF7779 domain-containing protein n=1 Tax=Melanomma pulvis-pyrius CBS 109.77 TaxID=1314802 RepID=A0A6A6X1E8_9PLEO|nr:hypothetical protein K505DRAFT_365114 [Melanomma pulvis-pyrius CBS 109.77]
MARLIHRRSWSIAEFVEIYKQRPKIVHGISGNSSINALWDLSFKSLDDQGRAILGEMCFLSPDFIAHTLFKEHSPKRLPESLRFCADPFLFKYEIENLLTLALIKRDKETRAFSIHQIVQTSFKYFMTPQQRQQSFNDAALLVAAAFPRKDSQNAQLYRFWNTCSLHLQHVLSLRDCFPEELRDNPMFLATKSYCELNNQCQRYLLEINGYNDLLELVKVNELAMKTMPRQLLRVADLHR